MNIKRISSAIALAFTVAMAVPALAAAATSTVTVTGSGQAGWQFNRDLTTSTPYELNDDEASIGQGSLYVEPIQNTPDTHANGNRDKFVAELAVNAPVEDFESVSYDFLIGGNGTSADAEEFYLNVYANLPGSTTFYDCRYDFVPATGSTTNFTTATFLATDTPTDIGDRAGDNFTCPATLDQLPAGSTVSFFALNVGDTSANDTGLAGYLDKVVVNVGNNTTTYDFEPVVTVASKEACKNDGWKASNSPVYKNQGDCVSAFASNGKAKGNPSVAQSISSALSRLF